MSDRVLRPKKPMLFFNKSLDIIKSSKPAQAPKRAPKRATKRGPGPVPVPAPARASARTPIRAPPSPGSRGQSLHREDLARQQKPIPRNRGKSVDCREPQKPHQTVQGDAVDFLSRSNFQLSSQLVQARLDFMEYRERFDRLNDANQLLIRELRSDGKDKDLTIAKLQERLNHLYGKFHNSKYEVMSEFHNITHFLVLD